MGLPENTQYKNYSQAIAPASKKISQAISAMPKMNQNTPSRKYVNTSRFDNLAGTVKNNVKTKLGSVTVPYGGSTNYEKFHPGVDIANKMGTNVPSFTSGTITANVGGFKQGDKGFGNYVIVTDGQGNRHRYSHLNNSYVKVGDAVKRGQSIAGMGNTGQTYSVTGGDATHLDYRVKNIYDKYINPYNYIKS